MFLRTDHIRVDATAKGTVVHQRIGLSGVVFYIRSKLQNQFNLAGEVQWSHCQFQCHQVLSIQAYQLAGAVAYLLSAFTFPFYLSSNNKETRSITLGYECSILSSDVQDYVSEYLVEISCRTVHKSNILLI